MLVHRLGSARQGPIHALGLQAAVEILEEFSSAGGEVWRVVERRQGGHLVHHIVVRGGLRRVELGEEAGSGWWGHALSPPRGKAGGTGHASFGLFGQGAVFNHV